MIPAGPRLEVSYTIRFADLFWTYFGPRPSWIGLALCVLLGVELALPPYLSWTPALLGGDVAAIALLLVGVPILGMRRDGTMSLVGAPVALEIDESGIRGLPGVEPGTTRPWATLAAHVNRQIVVLSDRARRGWASGWVPVPERAFTPDELDVFFRLLLREHVL